MPIELIDITVHGCPYCFGPEYACHTVCMEVEYTVPLTWMMDYLVV